MKKYIYSLFAAVLFLFSAGCSKDDDGSKNIDSGVVGEWRQTKWSNEAYADFDVYVEFLSDGTFNIFQKVETPTFVCIPAILRSTVRSFRAVTATVSLGAPATPLS